MLTPGADPVRKISIIPRGLALGVTLSSPDTDRVSYEEAELLAAIKVALGGRVAEEEVFDTITTGAQSDIQHLTAIARQMVGSWGMSPAIGPIAVDGADPAGMLLPGARPSSADTQRLADDEVRRIVDEALTEVRTLLDEHREQLDDLAAALLANETLDQDAIYDAVGLPPSVPAHDGPRPPALAGVTGTIG